MRSTLLSFVFAGFMAGCLQPAPLQAQEVDSVDWLDNYQEAVKVAKATGKPIFLEYRCEP